MHVVEKMEMEECPIDNWPNMVTLDGNQLGQVGRGSKGAGVL